MLMNGTVTEDHINYLKYTSTEFEIQQTDTPYDYDHNDCSIDVVEEQISTMTDLDDVLVQKSSEASLPSMEEPNTLINL